MSHARWAIFTLIALFAVSAGAQTSSLYVASSDPAPAANAATPAPAQSLSGGAQAPGLPLSQAVAEVSLLAVKLPEPRRFAVHDLVTILVSESTTTDATSKLDTKKDANFSGEVSDWPGIRIFDLLADQALVKGLSEDPKLALKFKNEFKGDGNYARKDTFVTKVTARIIDVKPNGTLVLEARKYIQSDQETLELVLTGTCRREDVNAGNTIQSTQLYDLRLVKNHSGELFRASDKGVLTKVFEFLFNF